MIGRLLIVGNPLAFHVGGHLLAAARPLGLAAEITDVRSANGPRIFDAISWRLWDRRPPWMRAFQRRVLGACEQSRPTWLLATGMVPLDRATLQAIGEIGVRRLNFLTDDPWNSAHRNRWFLDALPAYDVVFTPRRSNLSDLTHAGCRDVRYLPFGYSPDQHYPEVNQDPARLRELQCDILFVGGADWDRVPLIAALIGAGFKVALYGGYWERYPETRALARGIADPARLRQVSAAAGVTLVLVRRANRDGHVMRTLEAAACRVCLLVEDTQEHRSFFGPEGECVAYFDSVPRMIEQARRLLADESLRLRLAGAAYQRVVVDGGHTYADRLRTMLEGTLP